MRFLEVDLGTSLGLVRDLDLGPGSGPGSGPGASIRGQLDPSISDLSIIIEKPVKRPYEPINLPYSLNKPQTGLGWVPGMYTLQVPTQLHHPGYTPPPCQYALWVLTAVSLV